jgi:hypothetical protein
MSEQQYEAAVGRLRNEVAGWREGQSRRGGRLPERFWTSAAALVAYSSVEKVATATGLSVEGLKKRSAGAGQPTPAFIELLLPPANSVQCVIKVESNAGARMQCEVGNLDPAGLAAVIREFAR